MSSPLLGVGICERKTKPVLPRKKKKKGGFGKKRGIFPRTIGRSRKKKGYCPSTWRAPVQVHAPPSPEHPPEKGTSSAKARQNAGKWPNSGWREGKEGLSGRRSVPGDGTTQKHKQRRGTAPQLKKGRDRKKGGEGRSPSRRSRSDR